MPDNLSRKQRSYCMSRVRAKDTDLEQAVCLLLLRRGLKFTKHVRELPGCPDIVFADKKLAIFVDGDFWHGYRFPAWEDTLSEFWKVKIAKNRARDRSNFAKLRRNGWCVIRVWGHQIADYPLEVISKIERALAGLKASKSTKGQKNR